MRVRLWLITPDVLGEYSMFNQTSVKRNWASSLWSNYKIACNGSTLARFGPAPKRLNPNDQGTLDIMGHVQRDTRTEVSWPLRRVTIRNSINSHNAYPPSRLSARSHRDKAQMLWVGLVRVINNRQAGTEPYRPGALQTIPSLVPRPKILRARAQKRKF